jgi:gliding motility-associated-like protein
LKKAIVILLLLLGNVCRAQPFVCSGDSFLALTNNGLSVFYKVEINPDNNEIIFNPLGSGNAGLGLNAIGYRITDNYIYGISGSNLVRVNKEGIASIVSPLNGLNPNYGYFAGDISIDGQYLYILGTEYSTNITRGLSRINLDDYTMESIEIPNAETANIYCADFSIDPTDGSLYGFDRTEKRLVKLDANTGFFDESLFPVSTTAKSMGAIFFDAFGNLYGYGEQLTPGVADTYFEINKNTGIITTAANGPPANGIDGCSCPYTIKLQKEVNPDIAFPCTEVTYVFKISNLSGFTHSGINFLDEMPSELTVVEIVQNPFGGNIISGIGSNILSIEEMTILPGLDSIVVRVEVAADTYGEYKNQAVLKNLPTSLGGETFSDDPSSLIIGDSTTLIVEPLFINLELDTTNLCLSDTLILYADFSEGAAIKWNDGTTEPLKFVTEEGLYWVEVTNGCETVSDSFYVYDHRLNIELGPDLELDLGDSILLQPTYSGNPNFQWTDPLENSLSCSSCPETSARPFFDVTYTLSGINEFGCYAEDSIRIYIRKDRNVYIPNVFSPNFDGINDIFFIQGKGFEIIKTFRIFNRWGALIFESQNGFVNDSGHGWDGTFKGKDLNPAVFVYFAEVEYLDEVVEFWTGTITLVK